MNPYHKFVEEIAHITREAKLIPMGGLAPAAHATPSSTAPVAMFFSPHPDDECISGAISLRLLRQAGMRLIVVAVTQGSNKERQRPRYLEQKNACAYLGFELVQTAPAGLEKINPKTRAQDPAHWNTCVTTIADLLRRCQPRVLMFPHEGDWNSTHIGTHYLVMDALRTMGPAFESIVVESEFWGQMADPNLMVEMTPQDTGDLVAALTFHEGEVRRNPYHLLLPAWMMDNVRRGGELVGGQGGAAPDFLFAVLYRLRRWSNGEAVKFYTGGRQVPAAKNIADFLL